jgi:hypothetical protein
MKRCSPPRQVDPASLSSEQRFRSRARMVVPHRIRIAGELAGQACVVEAGGINHKADIYVNGALVGSMRGSFAPTAPYLSWR